MPIPIALTLAYFATNLALMVWLERERAHERAVAGWIGGSAALLRYGPPLAGAIYGVEMLVIGRVRHDFIFPAIIAAITSFEISRFWGISYDHFPLDISSAFSSFLAVRIMMIGVMCGLVSWLFIEILDKTRRAFASVQRRFGIWPPLMPLIGGLVLAALVLVIPTDYLGLSLPLMDDAMHGKDVAFLGFLWKALLVAVTLGSGFYGGIVTPQFVIGALAGNAFARLMGVDPALGAAIGMVALFMVVVSFGVLVALRGRWLGGGDPPL